MAEAYETSNSRASLTTCSQLGDDPSLGAMASHWPPSSLPLVCVISSQLQPLLVPSGPIFCLSTWPEAGSLQSARVWWWWGPIPRSLSRCILGSALVVLLWHRDAIHAFASVSMTSSRNHQKCCRRCIYWSHTFFFHFLSISLWGSAVSICPLKDEDLSCLTALSGTPFLDTTLLLLSLSLHPATHCHAGFFLQVRITFQSLHIISSFHVRQHNLDRIQW